MTKILTFKVGIEGLEDKIWRKIAITDRRTVADLAYTILATFDSLAYHLYEINYNGKRLICSPDENDIDDENTISAITTKLSDLALKLNDTFYMEYDYGSPTVFNIELIDERKMDIYEGYLYPCILDGEGRGMQDDISEYELESIVEDTDKKGYSEHYVTPGYEKQEIYDYRDFDLKANNEKLKGLVLEIKNGYEIIDKF